MTGCITNDLPYPVVVPNITSMEVEGAEKVNIDYDKRVVTVHMKEEVDLRAVSVLSVTIDQEVAKPSVSLVGVHDLTSPLKFNIRTYDDYNWTIVAVKDIERYFTVKGQIGTSVIDAANRRAIATVGGKVNVAEVEVTSLKLGPAGVSKYSMELSQMKDFTHGLSVDVTSFDETQTWTLYVEVSEISVQIKDINAWTYDAYVTANGEAGKTNSFQYREKGTEQWIDVNPSDITSDGGSFVAHITGLKAETTYEAVAVSGSDRTEAEEFTTDPATPLPNHSFENISLVTGKDYYKWYDSASSDPDGSYMFWGSGDGEGPDGVNGSANLGIVLTTPERNDVPDGSICVKCSSSSFAGMLTSGNLFTGQFMGIVGTSGGKLNYGRPWTTRPKSLKLKLKYNCGLVDIVGTYPPGEVINVGDNDRCNVIVSVGDWDYRTYGGTKESPVHVNTTEKKFFTSDSEGIIGYGEFVLGESTDGWIEVEIPIEYRSLTRKPTHIIITCATSMRGDYFTGSSKSVLWLDDFDLIY